MFFKNHKLSQIYYKTYNNYIETYNNYIEQIESERNAKMNGINHNKYYILFSHHFHLFKLLKIIIEEFNKNNITGKYKI